MCAETALMTAERSCFQAGRWFATRRNLRSYGSTFRARTASQDHQSLIETGCPVEKLIEDALA
jgi:hypothetical protein